MSILIQSILGLFISFLILYFNPRNKFLAFFFLLNYLHGFVHYYLFHYGNVQIVSLLLINSFPIFYLIGPTYYIYLRGLSSEVQEVKKSDWIHLIPFVAAILFAIPYAIQPADIQMAIAKELIEGKVDILQKYHVWAPPILWYFISRHFFSSAYLLIYGFITFRKIVKDEIKMTDRAKRWFYFFILTTNLIHLGPLIFTFNIGLNHSIQVGQSVGLVVFSGLGLLVNLSVFFFPEILYGSFLQKIRKEIIQQNKADVNYSKEEILNFEKNLKSYLLSKPFLDVNFNKAKVIVDLDLSDKFFTYYFNEYLGHNFNQWKSDLRIDESIQLIQNNFLQTKTVESLAHAVGFQSRNKFSEAFKKKIGVSPSEYLRK